MRQSGECPLPCGPELESSKAGRRAVGRGLAATAGAGASSGSGSRSRGWARASACSRRWASRPGSARRATGAHRRSWGRRARGRPRGGTAEAWRAVRLLALSSATFFNCENRHGREGREEGGASIGVGVSGRSTAGACRQPLDPSLANAHARRGGALEWPCRAGSLAW